MTIESQTLDKLVAAAIPVSPDDPMTAAALADAIGVPLTRIRSSIARIKDRHPNLPLTVSSDGYLWSREQDDVQRHATREVRYVTTRTRRSLVEGLLAPYMSQCSTDEVVKARQRIEFILDDLASVARTIEGRWSEAGEVS